MDVDSQTLEQSLIALEERVRSLEQTVSSLQDTRQIEERIAERVTAQVPRVPVAAMVEAITAQPLPAPVASIVNAAAQPSTLKQVARSSWLLFDMAHEVVAVGRMLVDPHYHTAWITRFVLIAFAIAIFLSGLWVPLSSVSWIGPVIEKIANLLLAGVLFLALYCETRRYKEWLAHRK
jgi:hypothetical protein